jgi:HK97 family phage major capsid protein
MAKQNPLRGKLAEVNAQISEKESEVKSKWAAFEEHRDHFTKAGAESSDVESPEFKAAEQTQKEYSAACADLKGLEQVRNGVFEMLAASGAPSMSMNEAPGPDEHKSLAQRALESPDYKGMIDSGVLNSDKRSFTATLAEMSMDEVKALITGVSDTSAGAFITNQRAGYVPQPRRNNRIVNLITMGETTVDAIEYARQTTFTNVAAETAEATSTTTGTKPEATIAFEKVTEAVKTIAHWVPATRRSLADESQMRTLIESQLRYGLEFRLEDQIVNGNGTGENFTGILNTTNILTQAKGSDSVSDAIHKAITQIRLAYLEPNGIAMHPNDWEVVRLSRDGGGSVTGSGAYLYGPPSTAVQPMIWGLDVAVTPAVPDDTALVGDFTKAVLWLREGAQVLATDSHSDFFVKNLVALLAELRAALGVLLPSAFCKVTSVD